MTPEDRRLVEQIAREKASSEGCGLFVWVVALIIALFIVGLNVSWLKDEVRSLQERVWELEKRK